ncbi:hypothetical protein SSX86_004419 [Deinandra increscens subsp. villosa]|uniref:Uncharacterized protein n=1 Tax=Deinandra increscens subsp. villosa TaxID=3103831 RepID=A0AAP0DK20_9ASTR
MTNIPPIFPIHQPQQFSDPQFHYFQVLEELEARNHKHASAYSSSIRSAIGNLHFKLQKQKPTSIDDKSKNIKKSRKRWWKNALRFFKRKRNSTSDNGLCSASTSSGETHAFSGPVYLAESRSGWSTRYRSTRKGELNIPYISLNEVNMDQTHKISDSLMPIYLVT